MNEPAAHTGAHFFSWFRSTRLGVLIDDTGSVPRGIFVAPAEGVTPEAVNRVISLTGGLIFVALSQERVEAFLLSPMTRELVAPRAHTPPTGSWSFCTSVEAREGVTTGISAADRAATISILGEEHPHPRKLVQPGHIFPIATRSGGVLVKSAMPEGALDLVRIAGFTDAAMFAEILDPSGSFPSAERLQAISGEQGIPVLTLSELTRYRLEHEPLVTCVAEAKLPTVDGGELRSYVYQSSIHTGEHLALVKGTISPDVPLLTRVQPEFTCADVFGGKSPPTRRQLRRSLQLIQERGSGVLLYLRRTVAGELKEQVSSPDTKYAQRPASMMREYGVGAQILRDLGVRKIELLTGSSRRLVGLHTFGIEIVQQTPLFDSDE